MNNHRNSSDSASFAEALEYCKSGNFQKADQICQKLLSEDSENFDATHLLGGIALSVGNTTKAAELLYKSTLLQPHNANARLNLGRALYAQGHLDKAVSSYRKAIEIQPKLSGAENLLHSTKNEIKQLSKMIESLDNLNQVASISFSQDEKNKNVPDITTINNAEKLYKHFGYLVIENLFSEQLVSDLHSDFEREYSKYSADKSYDDALKVGDKRIMLTVKMQGSFNNPMYYANPLIMPLLSRLLGEDLILLSHGAVRSLPGAKKQQLHRDHMPLFDKEFIDELPSFAVTLGIPLIEMNEVNGTTRIYGKTHREDRALETGINPIINKGSCVLFDYRVAHEGTPNNSNNIRPLMYNIYSRPWFRDCQNYTIQNSIEITDDEFSKIPEAHRHLFTWSHRI